MIFKWVNSVVSDSREDAARKAADEGSPRIRRLEGKDLAHEVLMLRERENARSAVSSDTTADARAPKPHFRSVLKKKVFEIVSDNFKLAQGPALDEVTEEITDQITHAAEADSYYQRIIDDDEVD